VHYSLVEIGRIDCPGLGHAGNPGQQGPFPTDFFTVTAFEAAYGEVNLKASGLFPRVEAPKNCHRLEVVCGPAMARRCVGIGGPVGAALRSEPEELRRGLSGSLVHGSAGRIRGSGRPAGTATQCWAGRTSALADRGLQVSAAASAMPVAAVPGTPAWVQSWVCVAQAAVSGGGVMVGEGCDAG